VCRGIPIERPGRRRALSMNLPLATFAGFVRRREPLVAVLLTLSCAAVACGGRQHRASRSERAKSVESPSARRERAMPASRRRQLRSQNRSQRHHHDRGRRTGVLGAVGDGGPATKAQLNTPIAVAVDRQQPLHLRLRQLPHPQGRYDRHDHDRRRHRQARRRRGWRPRDLRAPDGSLRHRRRRARQSVCRRLRGCAEDRPRRARHHGRGHRPIDPWAGPRTCRNPPRRRLRTQTADQSVRAGATATIPQGAVPSP
jgi:hypothetical protein